MEMSVTHANANKIYYIWKEIYSLNNELDRGNDKRIELFSKLLDLIGKETDPHDYFFVLRQRAQHYSLMKNFDTALEDLYREKDYACKVNDNLRAEECQELISRISAWHEATKGNVDQSA